MIGNFYVVYNADPVNAVAFFKNQSEAIVWRDANHPTYEVHLCQLDSYIQITQVTIAL